MAFSSLLLMGSAGENEGCSGLHDVVAVVMEDMTKDVSLGSMESSRALVRQAWHARLRMPVHECAF